MGTGLGCPILYLDRFLNEEFKNCLSKSISFKIKVQAGCNPDTLLQNGFVQTVFELCVSHLFNHCKALLVIKSTAIFKFLVFKH